jgi:hypothetical protein
MCLTGCFAFWECKPTYIAENKTYLTLNDKITIFPYFSFKGPEQISVK